MDTPIMVKNNTEFLQDLMEFSKSGALMQVFVFDALAKQSKKIAEMPLQDVRVAFGENFLISPDAWHVTAKELYEALKQRGVV